MSRSPKSHSPLRPTSRRRVARTHPISRPRRRAGQNHRGSRRRALLIANTLWLSSLGMLLATSASAAPILAQADLDRVAFKHDTGETATDTPFGIRSVPSPVHGGAVNLMKRNDVFPLYLTNPPAGGGIVAFGFVDSTIWTPANSDGNDLTTTHNPIGDRIYATISASGELDIVSAANGTAGVIVASAALALDPEKAFHLTLDSDFDWLSVYYGDEVVAAGDPFVGGNAATRANLGTDFVVSVLAGPQDNGAATVNRLARAPQLAVHEFPRVMADHFEHAFQPPGGMSRSADFLRGTEGAALAITLTNIGSATAQDLEATLMLPDGVGITADGDETADYGDLAPGASTTRRFFIRTSSTPAGAYPVKLDITGGINQVLETWVTVWEVDIDIADGSAIEAEVTATTPFNTNEMAIFTTEILDSQGLPAYFDTRRVVHRVRHTVPFPGVHPGDVVPPTPVITPTSSRSTPANKGGIGIIGGGVRKVSPGSNLPATGAVVTLTSLDNGSTRTRTLSATDGGSYDFQNVPYGAYTLTMRPPPSARFSRVSTSAPFELGQNFLTMSPWEIICPPPDSSSAPAAPPGNSQGQTGAPTQTPTPPQRKPPKFNAARALSMTSGGLAGAAIAAVDAFLAPKTFGASLASLAAAGLGGAGVNLAVDPQDQDLFYIGAANTVPLDPTEVTLEETVDVAIDYPVTPSFVAPHTMTTTYSYTRVTDQRSYTFSGGETLVFDHVVPLSAATTTSIANGQLRILVTAETSTSTGAPLVAPETLVQVSAVDSDLAFLGENLLQDDGQGLDATASDGTYTGSLDLPCTSEPVELFVWVSRGGYYPHNVPVEHGLTRLVVNPSAACAGLIFGDSFETQGFDRWSDVIEP